MASTVRCVRYCRRPAFVPAALLAGVFALGSLATPAAAQTSAAPAAPAPSLPKFGGEIRLRGEAFANLLDLDDDGVAANPAAPDALSDDAYQFWRLRYRLWVDAQPRAGLRLYLRLGNEYRLGALGSPLGPPSIRDAESRVSLDNGWAELAWELGSRDRAGGMGAGGASGAAGAGAGAAAANPAAAARDRLSLRFGRQDLAYGEGFLVFDGTPGDGAGSAYFDAVRGVWKRGELQLDLFTAKLADEGFGGPALDEDLYGLYAKRREVEAYVLHRFKRGATDAQDGKPWEVPLPRQRTTAFGARFAHLPPSGWQAAIEGAYELGTYRDPLPAGLAGNVPGDANDRRAYGGYARVAWASGCCFRPALELGGVYLSGDDPATARYEGWDDFYGEWPKWSELLIYTFSDNTTRIHDPAFAAGDPRRTDDAGAWNNLRLAYVEGRFDPVPKLTVTLRGAVLGAAEGTGPGPGRDRGTLVVAHADWTRWPGVAVQAWGEVFNPGDFYAPDADPAWYARFQIVTSF